MKWIPKLLSLMLLWSAVSLVILYIEPELVKDILIPGSYLPFIVLLSITIWYTMAVIVGSMFGSFILTVTIVGSVILTMLGLMHWGLVVVLLLTLVMESVYIYHRHEKIYPTNEQKNRDTGI